MQHAAMHRYLCMVVAVVSLLVCHTVAASVPPPTVLRSSFDADVDGDGQQDHFIYELTIQQAHVDGRLTIIAAEGDILWNHTWHMTKSALVDDLLREEGGITIAEWVRRFFDGSLVYGARYHTTKLRETDIRTEFIAFYGAGERLSAQEIIANILRQKTNVTFVYRASGREDVTAIVYVPQLKKFIRYTGFGY